MKMLSTFTTLEVRQLLLNDRLFAQRYFELALKLGYDNREKVKQHLQNLKNRK